MSSKPVAREPATSNRVYWQQQHRSTLWSRYPEPPWPQRPFLSTALSYRIGFRPDAGTLPASRATVFLALQGATKPDQWPHVFRDAEVPWRQSVHLRGDSWSLLGSVRSGGSCLSPVSETYVYF